jgi:hypothetical protein
MENKEEGLINRNECTDTSTTSKKQKKKKNKNKNKKILNSSTKFNNESEAKEIPRSNEIDDLFSSLKNKKRKHEQEQEQKKKEEEKAVRREQKEKKRLEKHIQELEAQSKLSLSLCVYRSVLCIIRSI